MQTSTHTHTPKSTDCTACKRPLPSIHEGYPHTCEGHKFEDCHGCTYEAGIADSHAPALYAALAALTTAVGEFLIEEELEFRNPATLDNARAALALVEDA